MTVPSLNATASTIATPANNNSINNINNNSSATIPATPTPDLSSLLNLPQFQGLVTLAQTNPALFNQLTNSSYFDVPASTDAFVKSEVTSPPNLSKSSTPISTTPINIGTPASAPSTAEDLESSLKSLASELGFESDNNNPMDYVNMDDFLNTYSMC